MRSIRLYAALLRRALLHALDHDCLNLAQSAAYSAMVALFPALIVAAAAIAMLPDAAPLKFEVGAFFDQVLPPDVFPLLTTYFAKSPNGAHTRHALLLAGLVSLTGASSVLATLMEGLRRAEQLPNNCWTFWHRRRRALLLVPLSLLPLAVATLLVVFGQYITVFVASYLSASTRPLFYGVAVVLRWVVALAGVVGLTALIFHLGTPLRARWTRALPGALVATVTWFVTTLGFGWYVTRFANYGQVYGSLGAGIALLFWLYIVFLSMLCGAEFNAQFHRGKAARSVIPSAAAQDTPNAIG